jgi:hypothetical protein
VTTRCGYCDTPLPADGKSLDFCTREHQEAWHTARSTPIPTTHTTPAGDIVFPPGVWAGTRRAA